MTSMILAAPLARSRLFHQPRLRTRPIPQLSVVIVNYRQWTETARLVRQLRATEGVQRGAVEIMVVDNHSPPHPLIRRLRHWRGVSLRRWGRNRGYARAVNEGCRLSQGKWLLLLNPDVTLSDGFLDRVLSLAEELAAEEPRAGIVGFRLRNSDGSRQLSAGRFPTLLGTLAGLFLPRERRKYRPLHYGRRCRVPWVTGCCVLIRRDCLYDLGGLDEDFFLYYEDVDLCRRAREQGWSVWYEPSLRITHHRPLHGREVAAPVRLCTRHALLTYAAKHWETWQFQTLAAIVRLEAWARPYLSPQGNELVELIAELRAGHFTAARRRVERVMARHPLREA
jgi:GT2 family glycosyltransferase